MGGNFTTHPTPVNWKVAKQIAWSVSLKNTQEFIRAVIGNGRHSLQKLVIVTHLVPGAEVFFRAVHGIIPIGAIIAKPNSIHAAVRLELEKDIPVLCYTRHSIVADPEGFLEAIRAAVGSERFALIDTGGYFCPVIDKLESAFGEQLLGIVEDTENGHQKYERILANSHEKTFPFPIASVARSDLKKPEDFLVGQAIVFSAEALLREQGTILTGKRAAVFKYGKVGRSIAQNLRCKSASVELIDINAVRHVLALAHGYHTGAVGKILSQADLIFCATGNQSLKAEHICHIKSGAYVFTATSGDDEIEDHQSLSQSSTPCVCRKMVRVHSRRGGFHLCNGGNSVNFLHGGIVGDFIKLVQAEFIHAATRLSSITDRTRMHRLDSLAQQAIAGLWLKHFAP